MVGVLGAQRRRAHPLGTLETGAGEVVISLRDAGAAGRSRREDVLAAVGGPRRPPRAPPTADMWTSYSGTLPAARASWIARLVTSPSSSAGAGGLMELRIGVARASDWAIQHIDGVPFLALHIMIIAPDSPRPLRLRPAGLSIVVGSRN